MDINEIVDKITDVIAGAGSEVKEKAKETKALTKLKSDVYTCEKIIRDNYSEIGKLYYEANKDSEGSEFSKQLKAITNAKKAIEELNKEIEALKNRD